MLNKTFKAASIAVLVANLAVVSNTAQAQEAFGFMGSHDDPCSISRSELPSWMPLNNDLVSPHDNIKTHIVELTVPADPRFRDAMGGTPTSFSLESFHAAEGRMVIIEHPTKNGMVRTDITFTFRHLLPLGVYSLWDVTTSLDFDADGNMIFADRPLMNEEDKIWLTDQRASMDAISNKFYGGILGMGANTFRADQCGNAQVTMNLDHRPGMEFLLDYHANDFAKGGVKGLDVFPGALWGMFPKMAD
ncbi:MAG: hypothetical protein JKX98_01860 [Alcanivoracaceae bacterium]|nr:hypothetical protein [Alcanivoracaceae bacterium]